MKDLFWAAEPTLIPGALRVYRSWSYLTYNGVCRLRSTNQAMFWAQPMVAECLRPSGPCDHPAPRVDCYCGIYGWYRPDDSRRVNGPVFGCIEVSGRVILGSNGVRAERARILAITLVDPSWVSGVQTASLADWCLDHDIRVFRDYRELIQAFPPEDLSALGIEPVEPIAAVTATGVTVTYNWTPIARAFAGLQAHAVRPSRSVQGLAKQYNWGITAPQSLGSRVTSAVDRFMLAFLPLAALASFGIATVSSHWYDTLIDLTAGAGYLMVWRNVRRRQRRRSGTNSR